MEGHQRPDQVAAGHRPGAVDFDDRGERLRRLPGPADGQTGGPGPGSRSHAAPDLITLQSPTNLAASQTEAAFLIHIAARKIAHHSSLGTGTLVGRDTPCAP